VIGFFVGFLANLFVKEANKSQAAEQRFWSMMSKPPVRIADRREAILDSYIVHFLRVSFIALR
jgi:hypothetical protein